jgi:uncharacterized RDD family membrane protein YckC
LTDNIDGQQSVPTLPRYFWHRVFAFLIDYSLIVLASTFIVAAIQPLVSTPLWAPALVNLKSCTDVTESQKSSQVAAALKLNGDETLFATLCQVSNLGLLKQQVLTVGASSQYGKSNQTRAVFYPVDDKLQYAQTVDTTPLVWLICPAVFALWSIRFTATPGKKLAKLRIVPVDRAISTAPNMLRREYLRFFPQVAYAALTIIFSFFVSAPDSIEALATATQSLHPMSWQFIIPILAAFLLLAPYFYSFFRWRGKMVYDSIAGFEVIKA